MAQGLQTNLHTLETARRQALAHIADQNCPALTMLSQYPFQKT
jgi:hypothetical protein